MATIIPNSNINIPYSPFLNATTGRPNQEWLQWLMNPSFITLNLGSALPVTSGGTGLTTIPTNGQLLIGAGTGYALNTLGTGAGISVTNGSGTISIANTGVLSWSGGSTGLLPATATTGNVTLSGVLNAVNGGTGQSTYAIGDLLYADTTTTLAKLTDVATGNALISGGVGVAPSWGKIGLTTHVSGVLPIANGGTNGTATPTAGAIAFGTGTAYDFNAVGTSGYFLKSAGSGTPTWSNSIGGYIVDGTAPYLDWGNGSAVTLAAGRMWYDGSNGSWNLGMGNGNITQQIGEELFRYGKASSAITDSPLQLVYKTGVVGASGVITFAPAVAGITDGNNILGCATENIALNDFGRITTYGVIHGITTNGTAYGEVWADNDDIYYNPVTGGLTKTYPTAPGLKMLIGTVINAGSGGSGSFIVKLGVATYLSKLSDVQITSVANNNILQYDSAAQYWKNVAPTSLGLGTVTSVSVTSANGFAGTVATATTTPAITLSTSITGLLYGNGTALAATTISAPLAYSAGTLSITQATTSTNGYLSSTDWNTFNNKQPSGTYVTSVTGTAPVVSSGGTTPAISMAAATSSVNGYLTSTDWSTFNNKQPVAAPVTKTADFTVATTDVWLINNKSGSSCTVTLPTASSYSGRVLHFQNYQAQTVVSASSNVVPLTGGAAGTSILLASSGDTCTLVSDGSNWLMTQYTANNCLLLE